MPMIRQAHKVLDCARTDSSSEDRSWRLEIMEKGRERREKRHRLWKIEYGV